MYKIKILIALLTISHHLCFSQKNKGLKIKLYASNSFTNYFPTTLNLNSKNYKLKILDYEWEERSSREFFDVGKNGNVLQIFDEPTNTFTVELQKQHFSFYLIAFHPKFLQKTNQVKYVEGEIGGKHIAEITPLFIEGNFNTNTQNKPRLVTNQNTKGQMNFELGVGTQVKLMNNKFGLIAINPRLGVGIMMGRNVSGVIKEGTWWESESHVDTYRRQGVGLHAATSISYQFPRSNMGIFAEENLRYYKQKHDFLDGTQKYDLMYLGNSVGLIIPLYGNKRK